ncbi:MAG TPA: nuclear transport factor 2 family protein [Solirubrobacterales bacterium]
MTSEGQSVIRRFYELSLAGDPACWAQWDGNAVISPPPEFPETSETSGVENIRRYFAEWQSVFGTSWWDGLTLEGVTTLPDGRLIADVTFDLAGKRSGAPFHKDGAVIYTVRDGRIVRAEHFMDRAAAREAAKA